MVSLGSKTRAKRLYLPNFSSQSFKWVSRWALPISIKLHLRLEVLNTQNPPVLTWAVAEKTFTQSSLCSRRGNFPPSSICVTETPGAPSWLSHLNQPLFIAQLQRTFSSSWLFLEHLLRASAPPPALHHTRVLRYQFALILGILSGSEILWCAPKMTALLALARCGNQE